MRYFSVFSSPEQDSYFRWHIEHLRLSPLARGTLSLDWAFNLTQDFFYTLAWEIFGGNTDDVVETDILGTRAKTRGNEILDGIGVLLEYCITQNPVVRRLAIDGESIHIDRIIRSLHDYIRKAHVRQ